MQKLLAPWLGRATLSGTLLLSSIGVAQAAAAPQVRAETPGIDRREHRQQQRIRQGVRTGELTPGETRHLERQQARIRRQEARAKSDGTVTPQERARLERHLDHSSRQIYREKHNRLRRD